MLIEKEIAMVNLGQVKLLETLPYDNQLYTQGIEKISEDTILISAGRYGHSRLVIYHTNDKTFKTKHTFPDDFFAEGLTLLDNNTFWLLSFKEEIATQYRLTDFSIIQKVSYQGQGWGIAYDNQNNCLWMTNGGHYLQKRNPDTFDLIEEIPIEINHVPISRLNELEYVDGYLYANIWQTQKIVKMLPQTGQIVTVYDLAAIMMKLQLDKVRYPYIDFLNGIAHLENNQFIITGKLYPFMMIVTLN
ncbi:glutaminyl-peptide cyclotransferase [Streptococcus pluranimalium]|uniref:glutaminyl-peptide cyclotransferase n=1 Tax=Streptococcus pluranimalium TaxID=82348 RepID=UPI003F6941BF